MYHFVSCAYIVRGQLVVSVPSFHQATGLSFNAWEQMLSSGDQTQLFMLKWKVLSPLSNPKLSLKQNKTQTFNYLKN